MECRDFLIGRLTTTPGGLDRQSLPADARSLVVYNPLQATIFIRFGGSKIDATVRGGWDLSVPGLSLFAHPIPTDATELSAEVQSYDLPIPGHPGSELDPSYDALETALVNVIATPGLVGVWPLAGQRPPLRSL